MAIFATVGYPTTPAGVGSITAGSPAERVGIKSGDRIVRVNGREIETFAELLDYVRIRPDQKLDIDLVRAGRPVSVEATTASETVRDTFGNEARIGRLGIGAPGTIELQKLPVHRLFGTAVSQTADTVQMMVVTLKQIVIGQRSIKEMGGPLKVAQYSGQQASLGWLAFLWFMTIISINLGFINLLPIPLLDGGHLLFYTIEGIRRKPLKPEAQEWAFRTGLAALLALMIFVTLNDLASFGVWTKLGGLIG